jgi:hypothetical protein
LSTVGTLGAAGPVELLTGLSVALAKVFIAVLDVLACAWLISDRFETAGPFETADPFAVGLASAA